MGPTSALVLFVMIWFMVFFLVLPIRLRTQGEAGIIRLRSLLTAACGPVVRTRGQMVQDHRLGEIVPGTHAGSPAEFNLRRKVLIVTIISVVLWAIIAGIIVSGWVGVRDFDFFNRMAPLPDGGTGE